MRSVVKMMPAGSVHTNRNGAVPLAEQLNMAEAVLLIVSVAGETVVVGGTAKKQKHMSRLILNVPHFVC